MEILQCYTDIMKMRKVEKLAMDADHHKEHVIERAETLLNLVEVKESQTFLEVGCGTGAVSIHCAKTYPFNVTGVDVDPEQIEMARSYAGNLDITFMEADATQLPFEDENFDIILSFGVTHHIPNWIDALKDITRVLKKNGHFLYWDLMYPGLLARIGKSFKHSYGITTLEDLNTFLEHSSLEEIHTSIKKSLLFHEYEAIFQKT